MRAIVLAGGQGTRLKAVTGELPKPMVPLLGRPLLEHILLLLKKHGIDRVCAALHYRPQDIIAAMGDGSRWGIELRYRVERAELGTAGAVRNCAEMLGGEDVLVISGDAACDLDLSELCRRHRESGAAVTLALHRDAEPLRFGLTVTDPEGAVRAFVEKPGWDRVVTDLVNTGIYVLSPRAIEAIPEGRPYDFARDLFPALLARGELLLGVPLEGYWCDVGTPRSYYQCCMDALDGKLQLEMGEAFRAVAAPLPEERDEPAAVRLEIPCRDRAALMGALSEWMLELPADYSDGIRLRDPRFKLHIRPLADRSALRIAVDAQDVELARRLAFSARDLAEVLEGRSGSPIEK
ncbi:MAG: nucleotidyltransferase family protein [Oscillospiraceae bacterium]|nr:nucleotidyltransferase family protein [Oscillospiraceae bacterium]